MTAGYTCPVSDVLAPLEAFFAERGAALGVAAAYLFGSEARGTARPGSDVDVAVLFSVEPPKGLAGLALGLQGEIERHLRRPVDLVVLNRAPADLVHRVLHDGKILDQRDRSARIRFEVAKRNEYFDLLPFLRRYRGLERRGLEKPA